LQSSSEQTASSSQSTHRQSSVFSSQTPSSRHPTHEQSSSGAVQPVFGGSSPFGPNISKHWPIPPPEVVVLVEAVVVDTLVDPVTDDVAEAVVPPPVAPPPGPELSPHPA
jgi:hypothetical protein